MASLFGDDPDPRPLWFAKEVFMEQDFDCDSYISGLRSFVPLETLRGEVRSHLAHLKNELVELINRDYNDFVNFSTKLVDVDSAVLRMRTPLQEFRAKLVSVRDGVEGALFALQDALKRRAEASASREILEMLLDTSHVVSKIEKLLHELEEGGDESHHSTAEALGEGGKDPRSQRLERISSEMNRLKFYVARVQELPFIKNMEKRIQRADVSLGEHLRKCLELGLEKRDERIIQPCLRAYVAIDNTSAAEEIFRRVIVAPFVSRTLSATKDLDGSEDRLEQAFLSLEKHVQNDCKFLLDVCSSENSGLHVFNFLGNSILREVVSAIQKARHGALSPGKPADFLENYKSSLRFITFVEGFCKSQSSVLALRSQAGYVDFMKLWNLGVYFSLRFQEIASSFDTLLVAGLKRQHEDGFAFQSSSKLMECLERCWHENVYIPALADKFFKLSLQLTSRYARWLSSGINSRKDGHSDNSTWTQSTSAEDYLLLRHDLEVVGGKLRGSYLVQVTRAVGSSAENLARASVMQSAQALLNVVPLLTEVLSDNVTEKCIEELKLLKGIFTTYRITNKPMPTRHSHYATNLLQPLKVFLEGDHEGFMTDQCRSELLPMVAKKVTKNYDQQIRDLVEGARKTESSLLRLRQAQRTQQRSGGAADSADPNISSTDKVYAQLFLDVEEHGRRLEALGLKPQEHPEYKSLWEFVAPPEKQNAIKA